MQIDHIKGVNSKPSSCTKCGNVDLISTGILKDSSNVDGKPLGYAFCDTCNLLHLYPE